MMSAAFTITSAGLGVAARLPVSRNTRHRSVVPLSRAHKGLDHKAPLQIQSRSLMTGTKQDRRVQRNAQPKCYTGAAEEEDDYEDHDHYDDDVDIIIEVHETEAMVARVLCRIVGQAARKAIEQRGAFTLAVPGGSVAKALKGLTTQEGIDWSKVHLFFVNERCPEQKCYKIALETFVTDVGLPSDQVYTVTGTDKSPEEEAEIYNQKLVNMPPEVMLRDSEGIPRFDMILIGMGADGHVGSIYPNSKEAESDESFILGVSKPDKQSITFSLPLMNAAQTVVIAATGEKKAQIVKTALEDFTIEPYTVPGAMVDPVDGMLIWLLDEAAGSLLDDELDDDEEISFE